MGVDDGFGPGRKERLEAVAEAKVRWAAIERALTAPVSELSTDLTQAEPVGEAPEPPVFAGTRDGLERLSIRDGA